MILVCAATRSELSACARGIEKSSVNQGSNAIATLLVGVGPTRAAKHLAAWLAQNDAPSLVVSAGFAGALSAGVAVGDWVTAKSVADLEGDAAPINVTLRAAPDAIACDVVSADHVVNASELGALGREIEPNSRLIVDMESAALARQALRVKSAFMVLRMVSDTPEKKLPAFFAPFASAMAKEGARAKAKDVARGTLGALADLGGVVRVVREGADWSRDLERGWQRYARMLA